MTSTGGALPYHIHNGIDSPKLPSNGVTFTGWSLVETADYTGDVTIYGLSGESPYMLILEARGTTNFDVGLRFNGDTTATYMWFHNVGYNNAGSGNLTSYNADLSDTNIQLNNYSSNYMFCDAIISGSSTLQRRVNYHMSTYKDSNNYETTTGSGIYTTSGELTSITIYHLGGANPVAATYSLYKGE